MNRSRTRTFLSHFSRRHSQYGNYLPYLVLYRPTTVSPIRRQKQPRPPKQLEHLLLTSFPVASASPFATATKSNIIVNYAHEQTRLHKSYQPTHSYRLARDLRFSTSLAPPQKFEKSVFGKTILHDESSILNRLSAVPQRLAAGAETARPAFIGSMDGVSGETRLDMNIEEANQRTRQPAEQNGQRRKQQNNRGDEQSNNHDGANPSRPLFPTRHSQRTNSGNSPGCIIQLSIND